MDEKQRPVRDTEYTIPVYRLDDKDLADLRRILGNIQSGSAGEQLWHEITVHDLVVQAQSETHRRIELDRQGWWPKDAR